MRSLPVLLAFLLPALAGAQPTLPDEAQPELSAAINFDALQPGQQALLAIVLDVPPGHYAQAATGNNQELGLIPLSVTPDLPAGFTAYPPVLPPPGATKTIPGFASPADILKGRSVVYLPFAVPADVQVGPAMLSASIRYQICNEAGLCYPPQTEAVTVDLTVVAADAAVTPANIDLFDGFDPATWATLRADETADSGAVAVPDAGALGGEAAWRMLLWAFAAGAVFNVVPCVLPVLPLKIMGFFEAAKQDRARCVTLALFFAAGMVAVFAALGLLLFATDQLANWGELFGRPWFAGVVVALLVLSAVGTFGAFDVMLPANVYRFSPRHDTLSGNALWGAFTAILSTPCTFGLFTAVLVWAAAQPPVIGVLTLCVTGVGMASPYVVLSFFPQIAKAFPRAGVWSGVVKEAMAFLLLAVAAFFAVPLLPDAVGPEWWWVIFGLLSAGLLWLVVRGGMLSGWRPRPVLIAAAIAVALLVPSGLYAARLANPPVGWIDYEPGLLDVAVDRPVIVKFTATWCGNCQFVEQRVFGTQAQLDRWRNAFDARLVKVDLTAADAPGWALLGTLSDARGIPFTAVYLPGGEVRSLSGIYSTADLAAALEGR